jgi:FkbM family methyltransferase
MEIMKNGFILAFAKVTRLWARKLPDSNFLFLRDYFRKLCPTDEIIVDTREGFKMLASPHDYVSYEIFFLGYYDKWLTSFMKTHITNGSTCWDIGTERGWFSLLMASMVGSTGRVDAFEAFPPTYNKLENNISLNNYYWVNANNLAVSDQTGIMYFVPPSDEITHHVGFQQDNGGVGFLTTKPTHNSIEVPTISIDKYAELHPFDHLEMIKIDIEGSEYAALLGGEKVICRFKPKIAIEYNRECAKRAGSSIEELDNLLNNYGYDRFTFSGRLKKLNLNDWANLSDNETVFNVYCFPRT